MESSQNENVMIINGESLNECNMEIEIFNVNFQTKQSIVEQTNVEENCS